MTARSCSNGFVRGLCLLGLWLVALPSLAQQQFIAPTEPLTAQEQLKRFHLPPGFEIQLVAAEPDVRKPINLNFDHHGRLFVTESVEYPFPVKEGTVGRDKVGVLEIDPATGRAAKVSTFVEGLNIPIGVAPVGDDALVYSIPYLHRYRDTDGDGRADAHDDLYGKFEYRSDTHGMCSSLTRWIDGWIYACHGWANTSHVRGKTGPEITMKAGNTFRVKLDGSRIEYNTHGQVNPFGLCFDPLGNLYSADCHTRPAHLLLRGAWYPQFGGPHDGLGFGPEIMKHDHGSTGIAGVAYYAADHFPAEYRDTLIIGNPVTGHVNHDRLTPHGSSYVAVEQPDFMTCDDPWFRPVAILVGPDGAIYIADFYNRIIGHYEVPLNHPQRDHERGRIWRIVYKGTDGKAAPPRPMPDLAKASADKLVRLLGDANLTVRALATHELVDRFGDKAIAPVRAVLAAKPSPFQRAHGMWVLERVGSLDDTTLLALLDDPDRLVRVQAVKLLAERTDWSTCKFPAADIATARLKDADGFVRRAAADSLSRHPDVKNVKPLLDLWSSTPPDDTHLVHVLRMALRDQLAKPGVYAGMATLLKDEPGVRDRLANVSLGVNDADSAMFLWKEFLLTAAEDAGKQASRSDAAVRPKQDLVWHYVTQRIAAETLPEVYKRAASFRSASLDEQREILRAVTRGAQERGAMLPEEVSSWALGIARKLLAASIESQVRAGIELARDLKSADAYQDLAKATAADAKFAKLRGAAIDACVAVDAARSTPLVATILNDSAEAPELRQTATWALSRVNNDTTRQTLVATLATAPERLALEIGAALADSREGAELLLAVIANGKASARLLQNAYVDARVRARGIPKIDERLAKLTAGLPPRDQRIKELIGNRRKAFTAAQADAARGVAVFQKHCANCHRIGEQGAKIGPNLDGIGVRGIERLLEDVLDPNRDVDNAFRTTQIVTNDGRIVSGLVLREEGQVLVLADSQGKEIRVTTSDIDQKTISPLSLMPANFADLMPGAEFSDLLAYLLAQKQPVAAPTQTAGQQATLPSGK